MLSGFPTRSLKHCFGTTHHHISSRRQTTVVMFCLILQCQFRCIAPALPRQRFWSISLSTNGDRLLSIYESRRFIEEIIVIYHLPQVRQQLSALNRSYKCLETRGGYRSHLTSLKDTSLISYGPNNMLSRNFARVKGLLSVASSKPSALHPWAQSHRVVINGVQMI